MVKMAIRLCFLPQYDEQARLDWDKIFTKCVLTKHLCPKRRETCYNSARQTNSPEAGRETAANTSQKKGQAECNRKSD